MSFPSKQLIVKLFWIASLEFRDYFRISYLGQIQPSITNTKSSLTVTGVYINVQEEIWPSVKIGKKLCSMSVLSFECFGRAFKPYERNLGNAVINL